MELDVFSLKISRKGISPLIATVLAILFGVTTLGIALGVVNPAFRRMKDTSIVNDEFHMLETLNTAIREVASESDGSKRVVPVTITDGTLRVNSTYDWLYFEYEPSEAMDISGEKGDIRIEHGFEFADYFNYYAEGAKATPAWTNTSGQWIVSGNSYSGTNGTSYHNVSGPLENWKFSATVTNVSGTTGGQAFALPTNPESLVGFLPMDESAGGTAYDYSGRRNNGTLTLMNTTGNATSGWSTDCKFGSCLKFDGVNDYITGISLGTLNSPFTVETWGYFENLNQPSSDYDYILMIGTGSNMISISRENAGANANKYYTYTEGIQIFGPVLPGQQWLHIVVVWSNTEPYQTLYLNGVSQTVDQPTAAVNTNGNLVIGRYEPTATHYMNGTIDEVMIFNRSLSADEVKALYETSTKKLVATGMQSIAAKTNPAIVLSNPAGTTKFDDVTVTRDRNKLTILVPFTNVELNGTLRLTKGEHKIQIKHMETNTTTSRPIVELTAV